MKLAKKNTYWDVTEQYVPFTARKTLISMILQRF